jgi:hypothetical protein
VHPQLSDQGLIYGWGTWPVLVAPVFIGITTQCATKMGEIITLCKLKRIKLNNMKIGHIYILSEFFRTRLGPSSGTANTEIIDHIHLSLNKHGRG